jgi:hypothetical protein
MIELLAAIVVGAAAFTFFSDGMSRTVRMVSATRRRAYG